MNPAVWVARHGRLRPDDPALADGERVHASWATFAARTAAAAAGLRDDFGLSPGDRVAIVMRNRPEYLEAMFAIWHAGLVAVPVNARLHRDEIAYILERQRDGRRRDRPRARRRRRAAGRHRRVAQAAVVAPGERWDAAHGVVAGAARRPAARRPGLAVLHERHDRTAQGRHAHEPQPAADDPQLLRRHRRGDAAGLHPPRRAAVARLRSVRAAARRARGGQRLPAVGRLDGDEIATLLGTGGGCRSSPLPRW